MFFERVQFNYSQNKYSSIVHLQRDWLMDVT